MTDNPHTRQHRRRERFLLFSASATYVAVLVAYLASR